MLNNRRQVALWLNAAAGTRRKRGPTGREWAIQHARETVAHARTLRGLISQRLAA